jgi:hypothetical protein
MSIFDRLSRPFDPSQVSWRAQSIKADGTAAMALCYIDARDVMRRLDEVCGPDGWSDSYTETGKGRLICTIAIKCGGEWISKSDGAGDTDVEGEKGAISDAFKRAAVKWGVGRYLYDMDAVWAECDSYERNGKKVWKRWTPRGAAQLNAAAGNVVAPVLPRRDDTPETLDQSAAIAAIMQLSQASGVTVQSIVEGYKVSALDELTSDQAARTIAALKRRIDQNSQKEAA